MPPPKKLGFYGQSRKHDVLTFVYIYINFLISNFDIRYSDLLFNDTVKFVKS